MKKKPIPKKQKASMSFSKAIDVAKARTNNYGNRPRLRNRIESTLGKEYNLFIEACCDENVSTNAIWRALIDSGITVSYGWVLLERPKIQEEYGYYYDKGRKSDFATMLSDPESHGALVHRINFDDLDLPAFEPER